MTKPLPDKRIADTIKQLTGHEQTNKKTPNNTTKSNRNLLNANHQQNNSISAELNKSFTKHQLQNQSPTIPPHNKLTNTAPQKDNTKLALTFLGNNSTNGPVSQIQFNRLFKLIQNSDRENLQEYIPTIIQETFINARIKSSEDTILHFAIRKQDSEIISLLVNAYKKQQIDTNSLKNKEGKTPLDLAKELQNTAAISLLKPSGNTQITDQSSPSSSISSTSSQNNLNLSSNTNKKEELGVSLFDAIRRTDINQVKFLIKEGVNVNLHQDRDGYRAIHAAAEKNSPEILQILIDNGADINSITEYEETPLDIAEKWNCKEAITFLKSLTNAPATDQSSPNQSAKTINTQENQTLISNTNQKNIETLNKKLLKALNENDINQVNSLIKEGANVNFFDKNGDTPLHIAIRKGYQELVEILTSSPNIEVNAINIYGQSSLHIATFYGQQEIVKVLLSHLNINSNIIDNHGDTPLHLAAHTGNYELAKTLLLSPNINVFARNKQGETSLKISKDLKNIKTANLLESFIDSQTINQSSPIKYTQHTNTEKNSLNNTKQKDIKSLSEDLIRAVIIGNTGKVKSLIKEGADVNFINRDGHRALDLAVVFNHTEILQILIDSGAEVNFHHPEYLRSPLHLAVRASDKKLVETLLSSPNINVNYLDKHGNTPLHSAVKQNNLELVEILLLSPDIKVNIPNKEGKTPLDYANNNPEIASRLLIATMLLTALSKSQIINTNNTDTLSLGLIQNNKAKEELTEFEQLNDSLIKSAENNNLSDMMKFVKLRARARPNTQDSYGNTALHYVCKHNNSEAINLLLTHRANVNSQDHDGRTPLHTSIFHNKIEAAELLLKNEAGVNITDKNGTTPLHIAVEQKSTDLVNLLISYDANTYAKDTQGNTPLHLACHLGNMEIINILLEHNAEINIKNKSGQTPLTALRGYLSTNSKNLDNNQKEKITFILKTLQEKTDIKPFTLRTIRKDLKYYMNLQKENPEERISNLKNNTTVDKILDFFKKSRSDTLTKANQSNHSDHLKATTEETLRYSKSDKSIQINSNDKSNLDFTLESNSSEILSTFDKASFNNTSLLDQNQEYKNTALHHACIEQNIDAVNFILNSNADYIFAKGAFKKTPFHIAVQIGNTAILKELLSKSKESRESAVNFQDIYDNTPLHYACYTGNIEMINMFLEYEGETNIENSSGQTPLMVLQRYFNEYSEDLDNNERKQIEAIIKKLKKNTNEKSTLQTARKDLRNYVTLQKSRFKEKISTLKSHNSIDKRSNLNEKNKLDKSATEHTTHEQSKTSEHQDKDYFGPFVDDKYIFKLDSSTIQIDQKNGQTIAADSSRKLTFSTFGHNLFESQDTSANLSNFKSISPISSSTKQKPLVPLRTSSIANKTNVLSDTKTNNYATIKPNKKKITLDENNNSQNPNPNILETDNNKLIGAVNPQTISDSKLILPTNPNPVKPPVLIKPSVIVNKANHNNTSSSHTGVSNTLNTYKKQVRFNGSITETNNYASAKPKNFQPKSILKNSKIAPIQSNIENSKSGKSV